MGSPNQSSSMPLVPSGESRTSTVSRNTNRSLQLSLCRRPRRNKKRKFCLQTPGCQWVKEAPSTERCQPITPAPTGSPSSLQSKNPSQTPSAQPSPEESSPPSPQADILVFYNNEETLLDMNIVEASTRAKVRESFTYFLDLGLVKESDAGTAAKDVMALIQASLTTSISFDLKVDDDWITEEFAGGVFLSILAYSGCDSAVTCGAAHITPTPLIPDEVAMTGIEKDIIFKTSNAILEDDNFSPHGVHMFDESFVTSNANFILTGKGANDIFLKAKIRVDLDTYAGNDAITDVSVIVKDWVVFVENGFNLKVTKNDSAYTLAPAVAPV